MESQHTAARYELARRSGPSEPYGIASMLCFAPFLFVVCLIVISARATDARLPGAPGQDAPRNSESPLAQARAFLADNRVDQAESAVRGYLVQHQTSADAHFLLGLILFRKIQAEALEGRALSEGSEAASKLDGSKFRQENAKASLAEYTEGAKYEKPSASDLKIVALDYVLLGSYGDASKWLARSVEENPQDPEAWYYLGRSRYNENRFEEAIEAYLSCLELEPRNVKAQSNLGLSYAGLNRIPEAQAAFRKAIDWQIDSSAKNVEPYIDLGDLLIQQNRLQEAVSYLMQAVEIAPRESRAREKLGSAYLNLNDLPAAQEQLERAVGLDPRNPSSHYLLGSVYRKQGHAEKAKAEFDRFQTLKEVTGTSRP
jgi:tetratricopeptide (TPR) repeat protein